MVYFSQLDNGLGTQTNDTCLEDAETNAKNSIKSLPPLLYTSIGQNQHNSISIAC